VLSFYLNNTTILQYLIIFLLLLLTIVFIQIYNKVAIYFNILANPNFRTLHEISTPRGGGVVFSLIFVFSISAFEVYSNSYGLIFYIFGLGGFLSTMFGFIDDIYNIRAKFKLLIQLFLGAWTLYWLNLDGLFESIWVPQFIVIPLMLLFMVWVINAYNFIDGIDGMAASGAIFISLTLAVLLTVNSGSLALTYIFILLAVTVSGFIIFNWPPAKIFMGDAGSVFLGYIFGSLILFTVLNNDISIYSWLTVFGYYFADTLVTQIYRVFLVKKWYLAHRSHAYQNLARITKSHLKVTGGVVIYNLLWVLPLTIMSALVPDIGYITAILSILPALIVSHKYGPILSSS
jgi:Fuc2NAc and GlcNAc transferase